MLDLDTRTAILRLHQEGHGLRAIARWVGISRNAVRRVVHSGRAEVPPLVREPDLGPHLDRIRELYARCEGNRVRVIEELGAEGISVAYSTLTRFCRAQGIGMPPKERSGHYHFGPGEEMQHDTSPHRILLGAKQRLVQCASLVLCYSRRLFAKVYPRWSRFECKCFLTEALQYMGGAAGRCMLDNSSVIIVSGTGPDAVPAPEMEAFAKRFGFKFVAHSVGDANRSARVERPFYYIERNFYPGRTFAGFADCNQQLRTWCDKVNDRPKRELAGTPNERLVTERAALRPLPAYVPEVYELYTRRVDVDGFVCLHTNRYSVPDPCLGQVLEVRETGEKVRIFQGHELVVEHEKLEPGLGERVTLPEHHSTRPHRRTPLPPSPEEKLLAAAAPEFERLIAALKTRHGGQALRAVRTLYRIYTDYPLEAIVPTLRLALDHGLTDLGRIERMILRHLSGPYFRFPNQESDDG